MNKMNKMKKYEELRKSLAPNARFSRTTVLSNSDFSEKLDCEGIREVGKDGKLHKPILPITGTVYCIDFSETFYKRILKHLVTIAFALRTKYKCRTFVDNVGCIYTVTTISRQEFDAVADREITMCIAALHRNDLVRNKVDLLTEVVATAFAARLLGLA